MRRDAHGLSARVTTRGFVLLSLLGAACATTPARKIVTRETIGTEFYSLAADGVRSLTCRVNFPALSYLADQLVRTHKIAAEDASRLRDQASLLTAYTDGTPCHIQARRLPDLKDRATRETVDHFADVLSSAAHGSCQMFALGYLRSPIDFANVRERWVNGEDGSWTLRDERIKISADLMRAEVMVNPRLKPFRIDYYALNQFHLPKAVAGDLEGQGEMSYTVTYDIVAGRPVPVTTHLVVEKPGREPTKMALEFSECVVTP